MPEQIEFSPSWPEWTAITTDDDTDPADENHLDEYHGECFRCIGKTDGTRAAVIAWAQDHATCKDPGPAHPPALPASGDDHVITTLK